MDGHDPELVTRVSKSAEQLTAVDTIIGRKQLSVSEDASYLLNRVQNIGGQATFVGIGASNPSGHHRPHFDIDEKALEIGIDVVVKTFNELSRIEHE